MRRRGRTGCGLAMVSMPHSLAGTRVGAATFRFPSGKAANILIRTSDSEVGSTAADSRFDPVTGTVTGSVTSGNFCGYIGVQIRPTKTSGLTTRSTSLFTSITNLSRMARGTMPPCLPAQTLRKAALALVPLVSQRQATDLGCMCPSLQVRRCTFGSASRTFPWPTLRPISSLRHPSRPLRRPWLLVPRLPGRRDSSRSISAAAHPIKGRYFTRRCITHYKRLRHTAMLTVNTRAWITRCIAFPLTADSVRELFRVGRLPFPDATADVARSRPWQ